MNIVSIISRNSYTESSNGESLSSRGADIESNFLVSAYARKVFKALKPRDAFSSILRSFAVKFEKTIHFSRALVIKTFNLLSHPS
jgi:hypothetical protein